MVSAYVHIEMLYCYFDKECGLVIEASHKFHIHLNWIRRKKPILAIIYNAVCARIHTIIICTYIYIYIYTYIYIYI